MRCVSCGHDFEGAAGQPCPQCGSLTVTASPTQDRGVVGTDVSPPPEEPPPEADGPAWERQRSLGALLETIKGVLIEPSETFRNASRTAGIGPALGFGLLLGVIGSYIALFWDYFTRAAFSGGADFAEFLPPEYAEMIGAAGPMEWILRIVLAPLMILVGLFLWAAIVHLLLLLFGGAVHGFEASFRTIAYAGGSTALFQAVPFCGGIVGMVWGLVAQIVGLKEIHGISAGKAAAAVLLPFLLCCCALIALIVAVGSMIAGSAGGGF
jgi:hypothetical protein